MLLLNFEGYFKGQKGLLWTVVIYLAQYIRNGACYDQCLYVAHKGICDLSFYVMTFDRGCPERSNQLTSGCI